MVVQVVTNVLVKKLRKYRKHSYRSIAFRVIIASLPLVNVVTLPTFHFVRNVCVSMQ